MNSFSFTSDNFQKLKEFLLPFKHVNKSLLIELSKNGLSAKTYTTDKGLIKKSDLFFDEFCINSNSNLDFINFPDGIVKIPYASIDRVINSIDIINNDVCDISISWNKIRADNIASTMDFSIPNLEIKNVCDEIQYTISLADDIFNRLITNVDSYGKVNISSADLSVLNKLSKIDEERRKTMTIGYLKNKQILYFKNPNYHYKIDSINFDCEDFKFKILKDYFFKLNLKNPFELEITNNKLIARDSTTNSISMIAYADDGNI